MKKFQVTIEFEVNDEFLNKIPAHRAHINHLIEDGVIDHYVVTMESKRAWITFNADSKNEVLAHLLKSPLYKFWDYTIEELLLYDGHHYRLPAVQLN